ncbi:NicO-domain-containing protein [Amylostereum chailletii]|nr:NicO-domain-containing protein [Amylostereum chailletii]
MNSPFLGSYLRQNRLTLFGRSLVLLAVEVLANAACWATAGILFGRNKESQPILSLALLAWTIGLRHALDADHISAIDNATRGLLSLGQLPVTCGLFFSLGHSTIVIVVNVAIAISTDVAGRLGNVGSVGGIVGASVSATFLFIVGLANSIILFRILRKRTNAKRREAILAAGGRPEDADELMEDDGQYNNTIMMKLLGPVVKFVNRPWKMYPVGILFGFGFDTASSVALLAVSAIAKQDNGHTRIPASNIVILPLLFTAGMTLIDSLDSVLMLYSYAGFPEHRYHIFEPVPVHPTISERAAASDMASAGLTDVSRALDIEQTTLGDPSKAPIKDDKDDLPRTDVLKSDAQVDNVGERARRDLRVKRNMMSGLSIVLTSMSIVVAFSISLITIMGLIGERCTRCSKAADVVDGGGLAGRWWRFWAKANDNSGYIGAGIVGTFVLVVGASYGASWVLRRSRRRRAIS